MSALVVKDNALIEASHRLGEVEQRLILLAIVKAREECNSVEQLKDRELTIHADDYMRTFGASRQGAYKALKQAVLGLFEAKWGYKYLNKNNNLVVAYERFTQSAQYIENEATVKFMFANAIIPMLVELEKRFTSYEIAQVANLSSSYAMRLYEFLMQYKQTGTLYITLEDLRFRFGLLQHEYNTMSNFKAYVLDYSVQQISNETNINVSYQQHKQGRKIIGFTFNFSFKADSQRLEQDKVPSWQLKGLSDAQIKKLKVFTQQFIDLNNDKIPTHFTGSYDELFKQWSIQLKDPKQVMQFKGISEFLERTKP